MHDDRRACRIAMLAGTLARGGAEKQFAYMVRALRGSGAEVRVFSLTRGEFFERDLAASGVPVTWVGHAASPLLRAATLARHLRRFRPHIVQSGHYYANLHVTLAAAACDAPAIGAIRNDVFSEVRANGRWGRALLHLPPTLIANSIAARDNALRLGVPVRRIHVVPNVVDLAEFERASTAVCAAAPGGDGRPLALCVARLVPEKRIERFLHALALARHRLPALHGAIVGDGPEWARLAGVAERLGLLPDGVRFAGARGDVPALLRRAALLVLSSDHEGFPNVLLEAMAAACPVITTPAGDAGRIVEDGVTGYVVPFDDVAALGSRIERVAGCAELRARLGRAGRERVGCHYRVDLLAGRLRRVYETIAERRGDRHLQAALRAWTGGEAEAPPC